MQQSPLLLTNFWQFFAIHVQSLSHYFSQIYHWFEVTVYSSITGAVSTLTTDHNVNLTVCPKDCISITCSHTNNNIKVTRWDFVVNDSTCLTFISHGDSPDTTCGVFNITMISDNSGPTFSSTVQTTATEALDGALVKCKENSGDFGTLTISVLGRQLVVLS